MGEFISFRMGSGVALFALLFIANTQARCQEESLEVVFRDWRARQARAKSARYEAAGHEFIPQGKYSDEKKSPTDLTSIPPNDLRFEKKSSWLLDFERNRIRKESIGSAYFIPSLKLIPHYQLSLYDGHKMQVYTPREKNSGNGYSPSRYQPDLFLQSETFRGFFLQATDLPVLLAHGSCPAGTSLDVKSIRMAVSNASFRFLSHGEIAGRRCIVLASAKPTLNGIDQYWVDPDKEGAVLRWERYEGGAVGPNNIWARVDVSYKKYAFGWYPEGWTVTYFRFDRQRSCPVVDGSESLTVSKLEINETTSQDDFRVAASPGQVISDGVQRKLFTTEENGALREIHEGVEKGRTFFGPLQVGVLVAAILVFLGTLFFRRLRAKRSPG